MALVLNHRTGNVATLLVAPRPAGEGTVGVSRDGSVARLRGETFLEEVSGADYLGVMMLSERGREKLPGEGCLVGDLLMPWLRNGGSVGTVVHTGAWVDIGTAWTDSANGVPVGKDQSPRTPPNAAPR